MITAGLRSQANKRSPICLGILMLVASGSCMPTVSGTERDESQGIEGSIGLGETTDLSSSAPGDPDVPRQHVDEITMAEAGDDLHIVLFAPEVLAIGDTACFAIALVNEGPLRSVEFAGPAGTPAVDLVVLNTAGDTVRWLSNGHPPPLALNERTLGRHEALVVPIEWDLSVPVRWRREYLAPGEYLVEGWFPVSQVEHLKASARFIVSSRGPTRHRTPELCP